jgi:hypothetical protein
MCCHMSYGSRPRLPAEVGSGTATCPMAPDHASWLRWAPMLQRVLWLRTSPLGCGGLRRCHEFYGSRPPLLAEVGSDAVTCPMTPEPGGLLTEVGSIAAMCRVAPCGSWASGIKKSLAGSMQLGTHVPNAHAYVSKVYDIRAIMGLQHVRAGSIVNA